MKEGYSKVVIAFGYIISVLSFLCAFWICFINFQEIISRLKGEYTFYSQRATLSDDEAVIYFGLWTAFFIILSFFSLRSLARKNYKQSIIYGSTLLVMIFVSMYVDTLFYHALV